MFQRCHFPKIVKNVLDFAHHVLSFLSPAEQAAQRNEKHRSWSFFGEKTEIKNFSNEIFDESDLKKSKRKSIVYGRYVQLTL